MLLGGTRMKVLQWNVLADGLSGDGFLPFTHQSIDLAAAGFLPGDPVEIEAFSEATVTTGQLCEDGDSSVELAFDNFRFDG